MAGLITFMAKQKTTQVVQWTGSNDATLSTLFGSYIVAAGPDPDEPTARIITNNTGTTFRIAVGDWLGTDILNRLRGYAQEEMYKSYDYVSG